MAVKKKLYPLSGKVQHYSWGGYEFIPALLDITNEENKPYAEYWMGAHPLAPSELGSDGLLLDKPIEDNTEVVLGKYVADKFGGLPYLFKILDVREVLSIQVHPSKEEAKKDFAKENAAGIPLNDPGRNYKDENHKPELMSALSDFWLLHGFKSEEKLKAVLNRVEELEVLLPVFEEKGYEGLYRYVMEMPQEEVNDILQPLVERIVPLYTEGKLTRYKEDFWAARAALLHANEGSIDRGIFSVYLFNLVNVKKGDAIFQPAGLPHAYLEGQTVEIMANSDNVLRGGLTVKPVNVPELLKHVACQPTVPQILHGEKDTRCETVFKTPAEEFQLSYISLNKDDSFSVQTQTAEIFIVIAGGVRISVAEDKVRLGSGEAALAIANQPVNIRASEDKTIVYRASVPVAG